MSHIQKTLTKRCYANSSLFTWASPSALTWDCSLLPWLSDHWSKPPFSRWQWPLLYIRYFHIIFTPAMLYWESRGTNELHHPKCRTFNGLSPLLLLWHNAKLSLMWYSAAREVKGEWPKYLDNESPLLLWGHFGAEGGHEYSQIF